MKTFSENDLFALSLGATLLGSGGGGDPAILYTQVHYLLKKNGPIPIIQPQDLSQNALVVPIALIGAPLVSLERIPNTTLFMNLRDTIIQHYPNREIVLIAAEIGGCNALTPFMLAAQTGLPILDGDLIGRAFPKLNMCKPAIFGKNAQQTFIASPYGDCVTFTTDSIDDLEKRARQLTVDFGCSAAIATFLFEAKEQEQYVINGSLTRAMQLGCLLKNPTADFANITSAKKIATGIITEVSHTIQNGFLIGYARIKTTEEELVVWYQNEYLLVQNQHSQTLAETPAIIALIEVRSGLPLTSESLRYGLKIALFSLPAPAFWEEPYAKSQVNLEAFDLNLFRSDNNEVSYV
ncbi:MAG: DUF917 domain-containing protein [Gammaproteobacteria bacterium]|nr:DUF917 domain-containing protein [Gammaproteobacteria bacterium]